MGASRGSDAYNQLHIFPSQSRLHTTFKLTISPFAFLTFRSFIKKYQKRDFATTVFVAKILIRYSLGAGFASVGRWRPMTWYSVRRPAGLKSALLSNLGLGLCALMVSNEVSVPCHKQRSIQHLRIALLATTAGRFSVSVHSVVQGHGQACFEGMRAVF
jgi:hypothetical protein